MFKKLLISFFILLNIFTILGSNCPIRLKNLVSQKLCQDLKSRPNDSVFLLFRFFKKYAQITGLGARWGMFTSLDRVNAWFVIKGKYKNNKEIVLPLPKQSKRNFIERFFFDFRENQLLVRISENKQKQERYAHYLCRNFPLHDNSQIKSVVFELYEQKVLEPKVANKLSRHLEPTVRRIQSWAFYCPS